jgi:BlaI family penicillinase repressor
MKTLRLLTRGEAEIMKILWNLKKGFVNDIIQLMPNPKPAYNTTSTIIRILERKGFVTHTAFGKTHQYYPIIEEEMYVTFLAHEFISEFFNKSPINLVSYLLSKKLISTQSLLELAHNRT